jgi:OmpR family response regulator RpaB
MTIQVLVCDDDSPIRNMVRDILEKLGASVIEAQDGQEALSIFMREDLDLLVIDFLMPKIDGLQVIRSIRLTGKKGKMPIVLMSAISQSQILSNSKEYGPDFYVNKPFKLKKMEKLLTRVVKSIRRHKEKTSAT